MSVRSTKAFNTYLHLRMRRETGSPKILDYSRAPCLGADQMTRGLWEQDWVVRKSRCMRNFSQPICSCSKTNPEGGENAQRLILRDGREEQSVFFSVNRSKKVLTCAFAFLRLGDLENRREQELEAAFNAVDASNTISSLSYILPTDFLVYFMVDRLEK